MIQTRQKVQPAGALPVDPAAPSRREAGPFGRAELVPQRRQRPRSSPASKRPGALLKARELRPPLPLRLGAPRNRPFLSRHRAGFCPRWRASAPQAMAAIASVEWAADSGPQPDRGEGADRGGLVHFPFPPPQRQPGGGRSPCSITWTTGRFCCSMPPALIHIQALIAEHGAGRLVGERSEAELAAPERRRGRSMAKGKRHHGCSAFDSGSSWGGGRWEAWNPAKATGDDLLAAPGGQGADPSPLHYPADLYLEGSDQPPRAGPGAACSRRVGRNGPGALQKRVLPMASPSMRRGRQDRPNPWAMWSIPA